jgi:hypothetical protein
MSIHNITITAPLLSLDLYVKGYTGNNWDPEHKCTLGIRSRSIFCRTDNPEKTLCFWELKRFKEIRNYTLLVKAGLILLRLKALDVGIKVELDLHFSEYLIGLWENILDKK